ncbi:MAG: DbpA RNA binding domain-containing protein, partial [Vicinamibacterales bacterium]
DLDDVRVVVESLAEEFGIVDVAAAAVKLAHLAAGGDGDEQDLPAIPPPRDERSRRESGSRDRGPRERGAAGPRPRRRGMGGPPVARLFIGAGRRAGVRPADLVGAITNEAGITSRDLGAIEIADGFSLVEVPEAVADEVVNAMRKATLRGHKVQVRRDRDER